MRDQHRAMEMTVEWGKAEELIDAIVAEIGVYIIPELKRSVVKGFLKYSDKYGIEAAKNWARGYLKKMMQ